MPTEYRKKQRFREILSNAIICDYLWLNQKTRTQKKHVYCFGSNGRNELLESKESNKRIRETFFSLFEVLWWQQPTDKNETSKWLFCALQDRLTTSNGLLDKMRQVIVESGLLERFLRTENKWLCMDIKRTKTKTTKSNRNVLMNCSDTMKNGFRMNGWMMIIGALKLFWFFFDCFV